MPRKLSDTEVRRIRSLHREDRLPKAQICRITGHAPECVKDVITGKRAHAEGK